MGNLFKSKKPFFIVFSTLTVLSLLFTNCSKQFNSQIGLSTIDQGLDFNGVGNLITFTYKPKALTNRASDTIDFSIDAKKVKNVARVEYKLDDDAWVEATGTQILLTDLAYGQHYITLRAISNNGSMSEELGYNWFIDNEIPEAEITVKPEETHSKMSANIEFVTNETTGFIANCWLNGLIIPNCQSPLIIPSLQNLTDYEFKVQIVDAAGNKSVMQTAFFSTMFLEPKFSVLQTFIFSRRCTGCHNSVTLAGGADYTNYAGVLSRVTPGDAEASKIYIRTKGASPGKAQMPLGGTPLTTEELTAIADWINAGALNN